MQPNQQDPNVQPEVSPQPTQDTAQPLPYQVPEYLDLGPIIDPVAVAQKRRKKNRILVAGTFVFIVLCLGAVSVYWMLLKSTPQERFYGSLERQMQSKYLSETYTMSDKDNTSSAKIKVFSDFSDTSAVKTSATYELKSKDSDFPRNRQVEEVSVRQGIFFDRVTVADDNLKQKLVSNSLATNQWYQTQTGTERSGLRLAVRVPVSQDSLPILVAVGNFSVAERKQALEALRNAAVYQVKDLRKDKLDGVDMSVYTVIVDTSALLKIYAALSANEKAKNPAELTSVIDSNTKYVFWLDPSGLVKKITFEAKNGSVSVYKNRSIVFDYPSIVDIKEPANIKR